jgi:hypothetical protein
MQDMRHFGMPSIGDVKERMIKRLFQIKVTIIKGPICLVHHQKHFVRQTSLAQQTGVQRRQEKPRSHSEPSFSSRFVTIGSGVPTGLVFD